MKKTIIVTGAAQRIGLYLTEKFLSEGYKVVAVVRTIKTEIKVLQEKYPEDLSFVIKDFLQESIDINFWNALLEHDVCGFVHCASTFIYDTIESATNETMQKQQLVNCDSFINACTSYYNSQLSQLNKSAAPSFVAFLDAKLDHLNKDHYSYTISKLKLKSSIEFLAMTCAPKLRVNSISPGLILRSGEQTAEQFIAAQKSMPFGVGANLEDVKSAVSFLISQNKVTGQNITVDAGQHLMRERDIVFYGYK